VIAQIAGQLAAKQTDRVVIQTAGGVGYEVVVPLGVMERLPPLGDAVSLATELVVREDGWSLYGFGDDAERRFFQRLIGVSGVGPKIAIALMSALGVERGARAVRERNIGLLASVSGIGRKTAERLALELADKLGEFEGTPGIAAARGGASEAALAALERLGYATAEADRALRQALAADGSGDVASLVRRALQLLTHG
jgi:holliday junction DNA helicase RuvA